MSGQAKRMTKAQLMARATDESFIAAANADQIQARSALPILVRADAVLDRYMTGASVSPALAANTIRELATALRLVSHA